MASFQAAGTSYATHGEPMIPFYIFYSMFGFQRTGDQAWAFADARGRGFMLGRHRGAHDAQRRGAPARGRPQPPPGLDGAAHPGLRPGLRLRAGGDRPRRDRADVRARRGPPLLRHALQRELPHAARSPTASTRGSSGASTGSCPPPRSRAGRRGGSAWWDRAPSSSRRSRRGTILAERFGVAAEVYSATSWQLLRRDALEAERWNRLHPAQTPRVPYVTQVLGSDGGPVVLVSDWVKALPDLLGRWLPAGYVSLGTEGFGRSDTREALRGLFEIDAPNVAVAALAALQREGTVSASRRRRGDRRPGDRPGQARPARPVGAPRGGGAGWWRRCRDGDGLARSSWSPCGLAWGPSADRSRTSATFVASTWDAAAGSARRTLPTSLRSGSSSPGRRRARSVSPSASSAPASPAGSRRGSASPFRPPSSWARWGSASPGAPSRVGPGSTA